MTIYKVYAKCVRVAKGIKEITLDEAKELIQETVNEMLNNGDLNINLENEDNDNEFSEKFGELLDKAEEFFNEKGFFECGDFIIERSEEYPSRSNCYGWSDFE